MSNPPNQQPPGPGNQTSVLDAIDSHIALIDQSGVITFVNEAWRLHSSLDLAKEAHHGVGQNYIEFCEKVQGPRAEETRQVAEGIRRVLRQETTRFTTQYESPSPGGVRWFRLTVVPRRDAAGGAVVKHFEITDILTAERAAREGEERFVNAFENAPIGMALVSPQGRWLKVNCALCTLLGYSVDELLGLTFQNLTHPDDLDADLGYVRQMLSNEIYHYVMEKRYFHKQGHEVWVQLSVSLVRDTQGLPLYFISQIQDITGRKESELRLRRLNRLYSVLSRINEVIVRATDERELCRQACEVTVDEGPMKLAWMGEVDPATKRIVPFVSAGVDDNFLATVHISAEEGPLGNGPAGRAVREGRANFCQDVASDPRLSPWREAALQKGYRSIAAFPLHLGEERRGVMVFYAGEPNFFNQEELDLLASVAENISFALNSIHKDQLRLKAEEALRRSEEHYRLLFVDNPHPM